VSVYGGYKPGLNAGEPSRLTRFLDGLIKIGQYHATVAGSVLRKAYLFECMVKFDDDFKKKMRERMERFSKFDEKGNVSSKISVIVKKGDNLFSESNPENTNLSWTSDEAGPSPLAYFISSLAMCQMIHYGEHAGSEDINIDEITIKVDGIFSVSRPRSFSEINYSVNIVSPESSLRIKDLAFSAASDCYITNTLSKACDVKGVLTVNGKNMGEIRGV
jgi:uncharacterized OsmC-like protein